MEYRLWRRVGNHIDGLPNISCILDMHHGLHRYVCRKETTMSDNFDNGSQLVLSFELLQLMEWILEQHAEDFKEIIAQAFANGLDKQLARSDEMSELYNTEDMQTSI